MNELVNEEHGMIYWAIYDQNTDKTLIHTPNTHTHRTPTHTHRTPTHTRTEHQHTLIHTQDNVDPYDKALNEMNCG